jgi:hypothetical protein
VNDLTWLPRVSSASKLPRFHCDRGGTSLRTEMGDPFSALSGTPSTEDRWDGKRAASNRYSILTS